MALWYAVSASTLLLIATTTLYRSIAGGLDAEGDGYLGYSIEYLEKHPPQGGQSSHDMNDWPYEDVRILDEAGKVVFSTPHASAHLPPTLVTGWPGVDYRVTNGRWFRALSRRVGGQTYQVCYDRTRELEVLRHYRRNMWFVLVPSLVASAAVGVLIARRGLRPLVVITATARRIGPSRLDDRIAMEGLPSELDDLARTFNAMLGRLQDSFARLERFSADIAHELRTPVHALRNVSEVALQGTGSRENDREALATCLESAGRLSRLIERLLFLAKADDPRGMLAREDVDVIRELKVVREFYEPAATEAGVQLTVEATAGIRFDLERALFQRALGNLITNALAHTPPGGQVKVSARETSASLVVAVADSGSGVSPAHLPHLFDRFYRVDAARTPGQGVGLGLAIVRSIAELHGGCATAESEPGVGTVVTLTFSHRRR
ncbi:two-component system, OmpR family, heavy metal sensor histidine kinase CusS [Singulisphaera sp. GP187]|nr:two-component system, OmpR family, heavy metal sensor histidine kinase CusS [Singulisphaera sp. GP187]